MSSPPHDPSHHNSNPNSNHTPTDMDQQSSPPTNPVPQQSDLFSISNNPLRNDRHREILRFLSLHARWTSDDERPAYDALIADQLRRLQEREDSIAQSNEPHPPANLALELFLVREEMLQTRAGLAREMRDRPTTGFVSSFTLMLETLRRQERRLERQVQEEYAVRERRRATNLQEAAEAIAELIVRVLSWFDDQPDPSPEHLTHPDFINEALVRTRSRVAALESELGNTELTEFERRRLEMELTCRRQALAQLEAEGAVAISHLA
ncbi:hypothetical protein K504DRAFT_509188 [Pleomassaria siparia CBS 279.74]|uniref:Uncharacterized protein n=1 Tax=Pleomassaria siparia CBS 279.74 TaxID=1314801 RepID=A0A6G1KPQ1_9PLEO|nr:hypothetical protein K504DRAFT_509188 [Pleomassaria siparia CBS 279.74]